LPFLPIQITVREFDFQEDIVTIDYGNLDPEQGGPNYQFISVIEDFMNHTKC
jgi:hypothetical protein